MSEAALSFVEWLERRDPAWWTASSIFMAGVALASRLFYVVGKGAGRKEIRNWMAKNPAAGYQLLEQRRNQSRDRDVPHEE